VACIIQHCRGLPEGRWVVVEEVISKRESKHQLDCLNMTCATTFGASVYIAPLWGTIFLLDHPKKSNWIFHLTNPRGRHHRPKAMTLAIRMGCDERFEPFYPRLLCDRVEYLCASTRLHRPTRYATYALQNFNKHHADWFEESWLFQTRRDNAKEIKITSQWRAILGPRLIDASRKGLASPSARLLRKFGRPGQV